MQAQSTARGETPVYIVIQQNGDGAFAFTDGDQAREWSEWDGDSYVIETTIVGRDRAAEWLDDMRAEV